jgi:hypothetical protein
MKVVNDAKLPFSKNAMPNPHLWLILTSYKAKGNIRVIVGS